MLPNQKTIGKEIRFRGRSLQGGKNIEVACKPSRVGSGIVFLRNDLPYEAPIRVGDLVITDGPARRSTIVFNGASIQTVEHFLAALWGLEIDNIVVEVRGAELPALDGSAAGFLNVLKEAGVEEQTSARHIIKIDETLSVQDKTSSITIVPAEKFSILYRIDYDCPAIGREEFEIEPDRDSFEREIAPARTFCLKKEAEALLAAGFGQGATLENTLVMDDSGPVGTTLRFSNEPVRHKILDLIGDLYLLGMPIVGKVTAERSGHSLNAKMVRKIYEKYSEKIKAA
ncbi:MAG: UDP-3-O-acyl-N-acetylglucosamine deacetylase [Candidatus Omnitrophica bacterium]|nr:UDP-3-O-acyl-N-acetylglucosamine deacetylase [Candidatus Omnitrophota bacterium]